MRLALADFVLLIAVVGCYLIFNGETPVWLKVILSITTTCCFATGLHQLVISAIEDERRIREARKERAL